MYCILSSKIEPLFLFLLVSEYLVRQEADLFESCKSTDKFPWHSFHATDKLLFHMPFADCRNRRRQGARCLFSALTAEFDAESVWQKSKSATDCPDQAVFRLIRRNKWGKPVQLHRIAPDIDK